jgi:hypothetical protein
MTPEERYLFDLQGYLVVRGALPADLLRRLNESVDGLEALSDDKAAALGAARHYPVDNVYAQVGERPAGRLGDYYGFP